MGGIGLRMKCRHCGADCTDDYIQVTRRIRIPEKKADVLEICCPNCYSQGKVGQ